MLMLKVFTVVRRFAAVYPGPVQVAAERLVGHNQTQGLKAVAARESELKYKAVRLWTSLHPNILHVGHNDDRELCSILNATLRNDEEGDALQAAALFAAVLSEFTGMARRSDVPWLTLPWRRMDGTLITVPAGANVVPGGAITFRGASMPHSGLAFFQQLLQPANQRQYRTKMFLATSFDPTVVDGFLNDPRNNQPGRVKVRFIIRYDDVRRCMHVNYIEASHSEAPNPEDEFLFAPYSTFTVQQIEPPVGVIDYYQITILAAHENKEFREDGSVIAGGASEQLPLAGWH